MNPARQNFSQAAPRFGVVFYAPERVTSKSPFASAVTVNLGRFRFAGPRVTVPPASKVEPWHLQKYERSASVESLQWRCAQMADSAKNFRPAAPEKIPGLGNVE